ncbi:MAG: Asp-tRNA(Asn)/Glu-tRNA(Gln) amidotransferase subunit GatC [Myxococcaceae bacterium]|nr:Asp-tRNA(Asn)/Glu-tRNA(Gln) amidotransferase subunit GatC [Myxococcaceae bacterium]
MKLTEQQVLHVAKLARLALTPGEVTTYRQQLSAILDAVDALAQVDTSNVPPTSSVNPSAAHLRPDAVSGEVGTKAALANAPEVSGTSFAIPKVLE